MGVPARMDLLRWRRGCTGVLAARAATSADGGNARVTARSADGAAHLTLCGLDLRVARQHAPLGWFAPSEVAHLDASGELLSEGRLVPLAPPPPLPVYDGDEAPYAVRVDPTGGPPWFEARARSRELGEAEVEGRVEVWSLNFRDVLVARGAIPADTAGVALGLGGECFGHVARVGGGVRHVAVGDAVVGVPLDGLGSHVVTDGAWVWRAPDGVVPDVAAAQTLAYATAWLALRHHARLAPHETVLIHSAAGGVGLAALHIARQVGATVIATASTAEKRRVLAALGATAAYDSRDVDAYSAGVKEATCGAGVHVVLNSLGGAAALRASLALLRPHGRFVELGKRDSFEGGALPLAPFLRALSYSTAHLDVLMLEEPRAAAALFAEVREALPGLPPLPSTSFPMASLQEALDHMSAGTHIGKVLLTRSAVPAHPPLPPIRGAPRDPVYRSLLKFAPPAGAGARGSCVVAADAMSSGDHETLAGAALLLTRSRALAVRALRIGVPLVAELRHWTALEPDQVRELLRLGSPGDGRHVVLATRSAGDTGGGGMRAGAGQARSSGRVDGPTEVAAVRAWVAEATREAVGALDALPLDASLEDVGVDSLAAIGLARRIGARLGTRLTPTELSDHPTLRSLLDTLAPTQPPSQQRQQPAQDAVVGPCCGVRLPRALCLHGFRSSSDILRHQLAPHLRACAAAVEWVFVDAPRRATGPAHDGAFAPLDTYEWCGAVGGPFDTAWRDEDGLADSLAALASRGMFDGAVGFSQGGALATCIPTRWLALFSTVPPPAGRASSALDARASFHCYDPAEEGASDCARVQRCFTAPSVALHDEGHRVSARADIVAAFCAFVDAAVAASA